VRILLALAVMMLVATPAFAGHKSKHDLQKSIDNLNERIAQVVVTPSDDRREKLDKLERQLGYALFKLQKDN